MMRTAVNKQVELLMISPFPDPVTGDTWGGRESTQRVLCLTVVV
jgi:hypothetical protein